jgi:probable phosphoglycerate mutase
VKRLLVIRHGESIWNAEGRWQGWADICLSPLGEEQAKTAGGLLAALPPPPFDAIYSSGLQRAHQTAEIIRGVLGHAPVAIAPGLRERNVGEFQGMHNSEIPLRWPHIGEAWAKGLRPDPPGGEPASEFEARILAAIHEMFATAAEEQTLLAVSHGGVLHALEGHLGVRSDRIHNLSGRWVHEEHGDLSAGEPFSI